MLRGHLRCSMRLLWLRVQDPAARYGNVSTEGFIRTCEKAYGKDLGWFFAQWVTASPPTVDRPTLKLSWSTLPDGPSHALTVTLEQLNAHELLYRLPFNITISSGGHDRVFPVVDSLARQTFRWTVAEKPDRVILDKEHAMFFDLQQ